MKKSRPSLISTSAIAKHFDLQAKAVFNLLLEKSWIERAGDHWRLTGKGEFEGGEYIKSSKFGEYIGWPTSILEHSIFEEMLELPITVANIGTKFGISPHRCNALLAELGWQSKFHKGWTITDHGRQLGGQEKEDETSGVPYTLWARSILDSKQFQQALQQVSRLHEHAQQDDNTEQQSLNFDSLAGTTLRTMDGRIVEQIEDLEVANWFYLMGVVYAYHRPLADDALGASDFYLPSAHLFVECWHEKDHAQSMQQKLSRVEYFEANNYAFLELKSEDIYNLDTVLPKKLLKHGITVF